MRHQPHQPFQWEYDTEEEYQRAMDEYEYYTDLAAEEYIENYFLNR